MKRFLYVIITLIAFGLGGLFGVWFAQPNYQAPANVLIEYPTGEDVLNELQAYRVKEGLPEFQVSDELCNNIVERWKNYQANDSHEGLAEFHDKWMPQVVDLGEIMVAGESARQMVERWDSSPSHKSSLHRFSKICVYSALGRSVALLSN